MAVPVILRGQGASLAVTLPADGDYAGATIRLEVCGLVFEWPSPAPGATLRATFLSGDTARLPLGAHFGRLTAALPAGGAVVSETVRIVVTDDAEAANGAESSIDVSGGGGFHPDLSGIDEEPATPDALRAAFRTLLGRLRQAAGAGALVAALALAGAARAELRVDVRTAPSGSVPWAAPVVTNVALEGAAGLGTNEVQDVVLDYLDALPGRISADGEIRAAGDVIAGGAISNDRLATHAAYGARGLVHGAEWRYVPPGAEDGPGRELAAKADVAAATNGIRTVESDPHFSGWADGPDGTNGLLRLDESNNLDLPGAEVVFGGVTAGSFQSAGGWYDFSISGQDPRGDRLGDVLDMIEAGIPDLYNYAGDINTGGNISAGSMDIQGSPVVAAVDLGTAAYRDEAYFATRADEQLLAQLVMGSNVVFEVTNYNSRVRAPAARILQLSESNEYFQVWAETNGLARTLASAMDYADGIGASRAPRAWSRTTSGLGAEAPSNTTWISTPTTVLAGGYEYAKVVHAGGEAWVLCSAGVGAGADTNGFFRLETSDGEPLVSIERTESVLVGVDAAGISAVGNTVTIPVPVVSQDPPVCYATRELASPTTWSDLIESSPDWIDSAACTGSSGSWVWTIQTDSPQAFFQFRYLQPGETVVRNHGWTDLSGGIIVDGVRYVPTASGDTLTFTRVSGQ